MKKTLNQPDDAPLQRDTRSASQVTFQHVFRPNVPVGSVKPQQDTSKNEEASGITTRGKAKLEFLSSSSDQNCCSDDECCDDQDIEQSLEENQDQSSSTSETINSQEVTSKEGHAEIAIEEVEQTDDQEDENDSQMYGYDHFLHDEFYNETLPTVKWLLYPDETELENQQEEESRKNGK